MIIYNEDIQVVKVSQGANLTTSMISSAISSAYSNKMYAEFTTGKLFIRIDFSRSGMISVSSNIKYSGFIKDLVRNTNYGWNISRVKSFVYQWMNISRRLIY